MKRIYQEWITSIIGAAIMCLAGYYLYLNIKTLTISNITVGAFLLSVGFLFLFVKDSIITGVFKKISKNNGA